MRRFDTKFVCNRSWNAWNTLELYAQLVVHGWSNWGRRKREDRKRGTVVGVANVGVGINVGVKTKELNM